jgi:hypothetical protein
VAAQKRRIKVYKKGQGDQYGGISRTDLSPTDLTNLLAESNEFDLSYLSENSRGELAPGQARLLVRNLIGPTIIILVTFSFLIYQLYSQGFVKKLSMGTPLGALISEMSQGLMIIGGVLLVAGLAGIFLLIRTLLDMFGGRVAIMEGEGWKKITTSTDDDGSTTTRTYYVIADKKFSVQRSGFAAFENGRKYRVYFTPRRKILVNIEALD